MLRSLLPLGVLLAASVAPVFADNQPSCSLDNKCPKETPCCSQYGQCGVGAYCLGGCDPRMSYSFDACVPEPVCKDKTFDMGTATIVQVQDYLGDPTKADWVAQGTPLPFNGDILLTMPPNTAGTVLASTVYMWYGTVKARLKTSRGAGVVTAFILLSDVKDEIDLEFVGTELEIAQTNYYWQAVPNYTHSTNITMSNSTFDNFHDYEIQWTPDTITWLVDGQVGRVQKRSDTWNATANQWDYPQTPARLQLSIWPGGASTNAPGTVSWAGGPIDWNSQDIQQYGYDYAVFDTVSIECYKTNSAPGTNSGTSYTYNSAVATNDTVIDGDKPTVLKSLLGSGLDMNADYPSASSASQTTANVIPGLSGGGPGTNGQAAGDSNGGSSSAGGGGSGTSATGTAAASTCSATGFSQQCGSSGSTSNEGVRQERVLGASAFAALIAVAGMLWI